MPFYKKLKVGETVFGLWPGSGGLYFKGVIMEHDADDGTYDVKFEEGTTYTLLERHVKPVETFKALEPKSAQRPVRRRGRSSSASRSRSRSRTPGRKPVTAKNLSPSSKNGSPSKEEISTPSEKRTSVRKKLIEDEVVKPKKSATEDVTEDVPRRRSVKVKTEVKDDIAEDVAARRSTRLAEKMKKDETLDANGLGEGAKSNGKENDSESSTSQTKNATDDDESSPKLGSLSATLSILAYFSLVIYLYLICKQNKCLFKDISQFSSSDLIDLYNPFVSLCVEGFYLTVLLFSMLPFGKFFEIEGAQRTRHNGTAIASLTFIAVLALKYYFKVSASAILEHVPQFIIPTFVVGFVAAVFVAFKSRGEVSEGGLLHHFVMGSSQQVSLGGVNVKIWIHRSLFLALFVLNYLTIEAGIEKGEALSPTLALTAGMQIVFATEAILNERFVLLSLEFNNIKIGWMYLTTLAYPFMSYLTTRSILISGNELPTCYLVPIGLLFLVGFWIKAASNAQNAAFSKDPENPVFANMESLTAPSGEKLFISGWRGRLRHPNYLGDVLTHCAFALPCGTHIILPHLIALFITLNLFYRAVESDALGKLKYGPAWDRYCQRVPSRVIPRIF